MFSTDSRPIELPMMYPGHNRTSVENAKRFETECGGRGYRVILSGLGGDELLGGVPTGLPELSDLLIRGQFGAFLSRAFTWSLPDRVPIISTIKHSMWFLIEQYSRSTTDKEKFPLGTTDRLIRTVRGAEERIRFVYPRHFAAPSRIANGRTWWRVLETLPHQKPRPLVRREYRYPYLDRDLVEFLFRIPRDTLLRPRRRRSMMRAAMKGIVPDEIIERKRKAFRSKSLLPFTSSAHEDLSALCGTSYCVRLGLIHPDALTDALRSLQRMETTWVTPMVRVLLFELWARECNGSLPLSRTA
jgi:asparagine synthase (glutamine-hydrolysing)